MKGTKKCPLSKEIGKYWSCVQKYLLESDNEKILNFLLEKCEMRLYYKKTI